jgi:uncharacterized tellurite resistance protein B-like protein
MADTTLELSENQLQSMAQLLLGAAWADKELHGLEEAAVDRILKGLVEGGKLPAVVTDYVDAFDPENASIDDAVSGLGLDDIDDRRAVLELVVAVIDADFTYDFKEGDYLKDVAAALDIPEDEYKGHIVRTVRLKKVEA